MVTFSFFILPTVLHLERLHVSMWTRILPRWRTFCFSSRSYSCKKTSNEACSSLVVSESKLLKMNQIHLRDKTSISSGFSLNCGLQLLQERTRDIAFVLPLHSSLQEHLSVTRMLWIKQKYRPADLKLSVVLETTSCLDPSRFEVPIKEEPTECLDDEGVTQRGKLCSSILKKRRSKMNKHKYKKRRKKHKFLRRRLGK